MSLKWITITLSLIAIIIGLFFLLKKPPIITNYPSKGSTIVAFGDSLIEGVGATKGNDLASLLSRMVGASIINMGVSGNTSAEGLARVANVIDKNPKIVLVLFGGNDFLRRISREETFKNIDDIVVMLQESGAIVILLGIKGGLILDDYDEYFENIAKNRGALYVPNVLNGLLGDSKYMSDGIHPNDAGYKKIAEKISPILKGVLR